MGMCVFATYKPSHHEGKNVYKKDEYNLLELDDKCGNKIL